MSTGGGLEVAVGVPGGLVWCSGGWLSSSDVLKGCLGQDLGCPGGHSAPGRVACVPTNAKVGMFEVTCPGQAGGTVSLEGDLWSLWAMCEHPIPSGTCHSFTLRF